MAYETKDNTGSLFKNKRKEKETHPDYNGSCRIDGTDLWISAWLKEKQDGEKYFSFAFKRKDGTAERPAEFVAKAKEVFPGAQIDLDDSVPFAPELR
jgi:uncharacterized protein (DUF736 family)